MTAQGLFEIMLLRAGLQVGPMVEGVDLKQVTMLAVPGGRVGR
jgi:hypothetical protein